MTDRVNFLTVALEHDLRLDDAQPLMDAIQQLRGVLAVQANIATPADWTSEQRVRAEFTQRIVAALGD